MKGWLLVASLAVVVGCKGESKGTPEEPARTEPTAANKGPTDAAPVALDAAPERPPAAYFGALRKGRKLAKSKAYKRAIAAFEDALSLWPGSAVVLSELSWAAFLDGDYDRAIEAGTKSVQKATRPSIRAASLYNLGRAFEAKGVKESAIISYQNSLLLRPNKTVAARLSKLVGKRVAGDYSPIALAGPTTLPGVCKQDISKADCDSAKVSKELAQVMPPYKQVAGLLVPTDGALCVLGLHLEAGWYVGTQYLDCAESAGRTEMDGIQLVAQDQGSPLVRFDYTVKLSSRVAQYDDSYVVVCGVGMSKVPSCTPAIQRRMYQWDLYLDSDDEKGWDSAEEKTEEWSKEVSISPKGLLTIKDEQGKTKTQQLVFP